ncbi:MAG TPA: hypothetical protein VFZ00_33850 [Solirubrobacter sp.]|nr:hypothetical protein [Solirubrobacter sp.]
MGLAILQHNPGLEAEIRDGLAEERMRELATRCRHELLGYADGRPGTIADIEARLAEMERCLRSYARTTTVLLGKLP